MSATVMVDRPARPGVRARRREPLFDNARLVLVTLVVVGHGWVLLPVTATTAWAGRLTVGHVLDVARVKALLPFCVLGLKARREHVAILRRPAAQMAAVAVLTLALAWAPFIHNTLGREWL